MCQGKGSTDTPIELHCHDLDDLHGMRGPPGAEGTSRDFHSVLENFSQFMVLERAIGLTDKAAERPSLGRWEPQLDKAADPLPVILHRDLMRKASDCRQVESCAVP